MSEPVLSRAEIVGRCLSHSCPDCGERLPEGAPWNFPAKCPSCGMVFRRHDGFFLGAVVWNYGLIAFGVLPWIVIAWRLGLISANTALVAGVVAGIVLPPLFNRASWRFWLATYYLTFPRQLPSNSREHPEDIDD